MTLKNYSHLEGKHAFLSPSKYHWINYDESKLTSVYLKYMAAQRGTELHALAKQCIRLGVKMPDDDQTLNLYVNDAIRDGMTPEQTLYYSDNCFGTADTISFDDCELVLRISDLKTGESKTSMSQLKVYAAIFCLEYGYDPRDLSKIVLKIYQSNKAEICVPMPNEIYQIMEKIVHFDNVIEMIKKEAELI